MSRESTSLKKSSGNCLKLAKQWYSIWVKWCYFSTTAFSQIVIAYFLPNTCAKYYENSTMLSGVTAKNVGDVFWDTVYIELTSRTEKSLLWLCAAGGGCWTTCFIATKRRDDASLVVVVAGVVSAERLVEDGVTTGERSGSAADVTPAVVRSSVRKSNEQLLLSACTVKNWSLVTGPREANISLPVHRQAYLSVFTATDASRHRSVS